MRPQDDPVLVWGWPEAHICLGQHQSAMAELESGHGLTVVRRPLGGGGVWIDRSQACLVLVAPRGFFPVRTADWYGHALAPLLDVYADMGWPVRRVGQDVWLHQRKLAGSGAATIGDAGLVGSSFLLDFPYDAFAAAVAAPSPGFRDWLREALRSQMTSWAEQGSVPDPAWLSLHFRRAAATRFGWRWEQALLRDDERAAREAWREDVVSDEMLPVRRRVRDGIKLRAGCFLAERQFGADTVRVLTRDGQLERIAVSACPQLPESALAQAGVSPEALAATLACWMSPGEAARRAQQVLETACFNDGSDDHD